MIEPRNKEEAHLQGGQPRPPVRRSIAGALFAILVLFTQIGPSLACDVFDGPDGPGCPALFHADPVPPLGKDGHQTQDDCSNGPSFLALETLPLELRPPSSGGDDAATDAGAIAFAYALLASPTDLSDISAFAPSFHGDDARQRYVYLHTLRLRI